MTLIAKTLDQLTPLQRATYALKEMRTRLDAATRSHTEPIAIIGLGCRFPGASGPREFWEMLRRGVDAITEVPAERWDAQAYYDADPDAPGKMYTRCGGFVTGVEGFDAPFFGISPREAVEMDPQQRLLLEVAWEALEDAGQVPERLQESHTGVFVGVSHSDYERLQINPARIDAYTGTGSALSIAAGRISYFLGLRGPSLAVDTACSSSLVALHLAVQSLRVQECSMALAGGVNLVLWPEGTVYFCKLRAMAADGRCKTFDARADGYVRGEGCGVVVLKRLANALEDGDRILALVRGTAVNHDGRSSGLTVPNGSSQQIVIREALTAGAVNPAQVGYVEAHGTGTPLGDPIEMRALTAVYGPGRPRGLPLVVGSVKTNIGHLEAAAGVAGVVKAVLALGHDEIPPNLHFQEVNPHIDFDGLPVVIPVVPTPWPRTAGRRLAGVSAFGFGGTNAHVVVEEGMGERGESAGEGEGWRVLPLSARSGGALRELAEAYCGVLAGEGLGDVCYTAGVRRGHYEHRVAVVGRTAAGMAGALGKWVGGAGAEGVWAGRREPGRKPRVGFVFSGQGAQWGGMGRELLASEPVFREAVERCERAWRRHAEWSLEGALREEGEGAGLEQTEVAQPAIFAMQVGLAALYGAWGMEPGWVVGHSVGEIAAAHVAGILTLEEAVTVVFHRGRLMQRGTGQGAMAAVKLGRVAAEARVAGWGGALSVAAENGPGSCVLSGEGAAIAAVLAGLEAEGIVGTRLEVNYAFHSRQMEPYQGELKAALAGLRPGAARVPMVSSVTGREVAGPELDGGYWARGIRERVEFAEALRAAMAGSGETTVLEVGAHPVLGGNIREVMEAAGQRGEVLATLRRGREAQRQTREALGAYYAQGGAVQWGAVMPAGRVVALPAYRWQRTPCWLEPAHLRGPRAGQNGAASPPASSGHPLLGARFPELAGLPETCVWETELDLVRLPWMAAHTLEGAVVVPFTAYIEMALAATREIFGPEPRAVSALVFHKLLVLPAEGRRRVQVSLSLRGRGETPFRVHSATARGDWELNASGTVKGDTPTARPAGASPPRLRRPVDFSVMFFSASDDALTDERYKLVIEAARFADRHGFAAVLVPERHFTRLGCLYPNPSVLHAALARETERIRLRAGSIVLPLHNPIRVAEEWAMVDNLSGGRVELSFASGWHPNDFVFFPERYVDRHADMFRGIDTVRRLWEGEAIAATGGTGEAVEVRIQPSPVQRAFPLWITAAGNPETFVRAGELGANLLTHLLDHDVQELGGKIALYRDARARHGHDPARGRVAVMLHTFLGDDLDQVREEVRGPYTKYLKSIAHLLTAFGQSRGRSIDPAVLSEPDRDALAEFLFDRFYSQRALLGTPESCQHLVAALSDVGVDEVTCLLDFGPAAESILRHLPDLDRLRRMCAASAPAEQSVPEPPDRVRERCTTEVSGRELLAKLSARGPVFPGIQRVWLGDGEALAYTRPAADLGVGEGPWLAHPAFLGACLQSLAAAASPTHAAWTSGTWVVSGVSELRVNQALPLTGVWSHATMRGEAGGGAVDGNVRLFDEDGKLLVEASGVRLHRIGASAAPSPAGTDGLLYDPRWERVDSQAEIVAADGDWLILADRSGVGEALARELETRGGRCCAVGSAIQPRTLEESLPADLDLRSLRGVIHLWSLDASSSDAADLGDVEVAQTLGAWTAVQLFRALAAAGSAARVWLVTRSAQPAGRSSTEVNALQAPIWGLGRAAEVELADRLGGLVDLDSATSSADAARELATVVLQGGRERQLAFRAGGRYAPRLMRRARAAESAPPKQFRGDAAYLVAGGLGDLGQEVAKWMVDGGARHVVLLGRTVLPPREKWNETPAGSADGRRIAAVLELEGRGARVYIAEADVADEHAVQAVLQGLSVAGWPAVRGVFHAAGVVRGAQLTELNQDAFREVLRPKVLGGWVLHRAFEHADLDFFVLFSAIPSLLGWLGQGAANYAAANSFLDALAFHRRARGLPAQSVAWGPWGEVGMAARTEGGLRGLDALGVGAMPPSLALAALGRLLSEGDALAAVMRIDWPRFFRANPDAATAPLLSALAAEKAAAHGLAQGGVRWELSREQLLAAGPEEGLRLLETHLRAQVAEVLHLSSEEVDMEVPITRMGLDSLMAIELKTQIQNALGVSVPIVTFLQGLSVSHLLARLMELLADSASERSRSDHAVAADETRAEASSDARDIPQRVSDLSDDEVDRLLRDLYPSRDE